MMKCVVGGMGEDSSFFHGDSLGGNECDDDDYVR